MSGYKVSNELVKLVLTSILLGMLVIPPIIMLMRKASRMLLREGIIGENNRLDIYEMWEMIFMFQAVGSFFLMVYMVINATYGTKYDAEVWILVFTGTLGSNTASVVITYLKNKQQNTNEK